MGPMELVLGLRLRLRLRLQQIETSISGEWACALLTCILTNFACCAALKLVEVGSTSLRFDPNSPGKVHRPCVPVMFKLCFLEFVL